MRHILTFLILIVFCACGHNGAQNKPAQVDATIVDINIEDTPKASKRVENKKSVELMMAEWEKREDSLRNVILSKKRNVILKESFLQEMYIRDIVKVSNDSLYITIPFNLHGPDCGAPDCYTTDVSFSLRLGDTLIFPQKLQFQEHLHGCVSNEERLSGDFQLVEQTGRHIIYHSAGHKKTLVLFGSNKDCGTTAYYFTDIEQNRINGTNLYNITENYDEEDVNSIYPFTSHTLSINYEVFLSK